jgi:GNAT superfamily N-acetyltransferase
VRLRTIVAPGLGDGVDYLIKQYSLQQGALEIEYIEEFFNEFPRRKTAAEVVARLSGRVHQILMAEAPLPSDPTGALMPVSFKVAHELRAEETEPKLADLVERLRDRIGFDGRRILYQWIGGTRSDWRGRGHFRALTEEQEAWAHAAGFDEIVVKTKNRFYEMRSTLDSLRFEVVKFERHPADNAESKVYLSKQLHRDIVDAHRLKRMVTQVE